MSAFPTCPEHKILKPCPHCEPDKYMPAPEIELESCGDIDAGDKIIRCHCGKHYAKYTFHGYKRWKS